MQKFQRVYQITSGLLLSIIMTTSVLPSQVQANSLANLFGQQQTQKFLPVHEAFQVVANQQNNKLVVKFTITPKHYIYKDKLSAKLPEGVTISDWQFDATPSMIDDPEFGRVAVFEQDVTATATLTNVSGVQFNHEPISLKWQGCAKAGLCYPPETLKTTINLQADKTATLQKTQTAPIETPSPKGDNTQVKVADPKTTEPSEAVVKSSVNQQPLISKLDVKNNVNQEIKPEKPSSTVATDKDSPTNNAIAQDILTDDSNDTDAVLTTPTPLMAEADQAIFQSQPPSTKTAAVFEVNHQLATQADPFGIKQHPILAVFLLFLAGMLLAFSPCVYPMIPIVANIVARQNKPNSTQGLMLSASYGVGVATSYGILGAVIAWFGRAIGVIGWLQNPYVLVVFAVVFAVLALAMFDVLHLRLPAFISRALQSKSQSADGKFGSVGGSFVAGSLSALVVSPCVSLPMAGALTAVSVSGSVLVGFVALFMFGLGLSLPLMLIGMLQGKFMPKAGAWMNQVKQFCGLLLLAVSLSLLERVLLSPLMLGVWAVWFSLVAMWLWRLAKIPTQAVSMMSGIWSVCLMVGMAIGSEDAWRPLAKLGASPSLLIEANKTDVTVTTLAQLDAVLASHDKVLVDVTADWCVECKIMERTLFTNRPNELANYQVVKLDISETTPQSKAILERYQLFGPPALLLYKEGRLQNILLGEVKRKDFEQSLSQL